MVKKKKEEVVEQESTTIDIESVDAEVRKQYGDLVVRDVSELIDKPPQVIPISPMIDLALGGGIIEGACLNLSGPPKCGKTNLALCVAAICQKPEYGGEYAPNGREIFYYNVEARLKKRDLLGIHGLDIEKVKLVGSYKGKILHAQDYLQIAEHYINSIPGSVHIFDSYGALCTEEESTNTMSDQQRADGAKLLKKFWRKVCNVIPVNKTILIGIQHLYSRVDGKPGSAEAGGQGVRYGSDTLLRCSHFEPWTVGSKEDSNQIGQEVHWKVVWSALGGPGNKCTSWLRYGYGVDREREALELGKLLGLVSDATWMSFKFVNAENPPKFQGAEKARQALIDNPEWYKLLHDKIKEML